MRSPSRISRAHAPTPPLLDALEPRRLMAADFAYAFNFHDQPGSSYVNGMAVDRFGNQVYVGQFNGTVDFNPSSRKQWNLTSNGAGDAFVAKFAPNGALLWAVSAGGAADGDFAECVAVDRAGTIYVGGGFKQTVDFRPGPKQAPRTSTGAQDAFLWKLDATGAFLGATTAGGASNDEYVNTIAVDPAGNLFATGPMDSDTATFGPTTLTRAGTVEDVFLVKASAKRLAVFWTGQLGGASNDDVNEAAVDAAGNFYLAGGYSNTTDIDPGPATQTLTAPGGTRAGFVLKLDNAGAFQFVKQFAGGAAGATVFPRGLALDRSGNILVAGSFHGAIDFDPNGTVHTLASAGGASTDTFVTKLSPAGNLLWARQAGTSAYASVAFRGVTVDKPGNVYVGGTAGGTTAFGGPTDLTQSRGCGFVWKLSAAAGATLFARAFVPTGQVGWASVDAFALGAAGDIFAAGDFGDAVDFNPGAAQYVLSSDSTSDSDAFVVRLTA